MTIIIVKTNKRILWNEDCDELITQWNKKCMDRSFIIIHNKKYTFLT